MSEREEEEEERERRKEEREKREGVVYGARRQKKCSTDKVHGKKEQGVIHQYIINNGI